MPRTFMLTKLHSPRLQNPLLVRAELVARIEAGTTGAMTVIVAPAGYGKTTLVGQWAAQTDLAVAWLSLDEGDNDLVHFLTYVATAIQQVFSGACSYLQGILGRDPLPDIPRLALTLSNEFEALPQRCVLVLDDYHCITAPAIEQLLNELLRHPTRSLHLIITSRSQPGLPLARLRSSRRLNELQAEDLRLTLAEAEMLLEQKWQGGVHQRNCGGAADTHGRLAGRHAHGGACPGERTRMGGADGRPGAQR